MTFQDIADKQWAEFLAQLSQTHSRTKSQIENKKPVIEHIIPPTKPRQYTDEEYEDMQEQADHDRFMQEADNQNTLYRT